MTADNNRMSDETKNYVDSKFALNDLQFKYISEAMNRIEKSLATSLCAKEKEHDDMKKDIKILRDWKTSFTAKFSILSAVALVIGSFISHIIMEMISTKI